MESTATPLPGSSPDEMFPALTAQRRARVLAHDRSRKVRSGESLFVDRKRGLREMQTHRLAKNIVETELWQTVSETGSNINYLRASILWRARVYTLARGSVVNG